jgi:hypothetical protein
MDGNKQKKISNYLETQKNRKFSKTMNNVNSLFSLYVTFSLKARLIKRGYL